ncbi:MAG: hypothetical protein FJX72_11890 [Armatimonadetes bacterium]|nr:hypothetical protein [Armatimonadota bacterium]
MPEYLAPGVFIEEIDSGSKPIEGVGTNTAAFVGYAKSGEFNKPTFIANWTQFCQAFGEEENVIVKALCDELGLTAADVVAAKRASRKGWLEFAMVAVTGAIRERQASGKADPSKARTWPEFLKKYSVPQGGGPGTQLNTGAPGSEATVRMYCTVVGRAIPPRRRRKMIR